MRYILVVLCIEFDTEVVRYEKLHLFHCVAFEEELEML